jgi:N-acetylmuramoyl-L-alanine amidase
MPFLKTKKMIKTLGKQEFKAYKINVSLRLNSLFKKINQNLNKYIYMKHLALFIVCFFYLLSAQASDSGKSTIFPKIFIKDTTYQIKKIVVDAGHGGKDSGCLGKKSQEKNITLKIALLLGRKIKAAYPNIEVIYTRDKDVFIPLGERADIANKQRADFFISIHCNFLPANSTHSGSETYVLGVNRTKENLEIAKRENAAIFLENDYKKRYKDYDFNAPETNILLSAIQSSSMDRSQQLAGLVEKNLKNDAHRESHGVKQAGFLVLRETTMPSILVETGFLSSRTEEAFLMSAEGQDQEAQAIFDAFTTYKNSIETGKSYAMTTSYSTPKEETVTPQNEEKIIVDILSPKAITTPKKKKIEEDKKAIGKEKPKAVTPLLPEKVVARKENKIIFKVQIAKSPNKLVINDDKWKLINELEIVEEPNQYIYRADGFESYESAQETCNKLKAAGFVGAFVVAFEGKKRLEMQDAIKKSKME